MAAADAVSRQEAKQAHTELLATIGKWLHEFHDHDLQEPLPERITDLIAKLDEED
jgi:hypothetical protein